MTGFRLFCVSLFLVAVLASCDKHTVYHSYIPTPVEGWEQNDTLAFNIDTIAEAGTYDLIVGVRTTTAYPFQSLYLLVEQQLRNPHKMSLDTLVCRLASSQGDKMGSGISTYQYIYPYKQEKLSAGQSGKIIIRHIMRREILPGVSDIGVSILKEK